MSPGALRAGSRCAARLLPPARRGEADARTLLGPGLARSRRLGPGVEFASLREYREGDDPRRIDWRASARRPDPARLLRLVVRDYVAEDPSRTAVAAVLGGSMLYWDKLEALLYAAGLLYEAARRLGDRVATVVAAPWGARRLEAGDPRVQLAALAGEACRLLEETEPGPEAPGLDEAARLLPRRMDVAVLLADYAHGLGEYVVFARRLRAGYAAGVAALATSLHEHVRPRWLPRGAPMLPAGAAAGGVDAESLFEAAEAHLALVEESLRSTGVRAVRLEGEDGARAAAPRLLDAYLAARARTPVARV